MRIVLFGYGKMGKEIEKIALQRGHEIVGIVDLENPKEKLNLKNIAHTVIKLLFIRKLNKLCQHKNKIIQHLA